MMSAAALRWCEQLAGVSVVIQSLEMIAIRQTYSDKGIWKWQTLSKDVPPRLRFFFDAVFKEPNFHFVVILQLIAAASLVVHALPPVLTLLCVTTFLISLRWRGSFNGGSDAMTFIVLLCLTIASYSDQQKVQNAALWYISLQLCLSYFLAGMAKLKQYDWRNGMALKTYLTDSHYLVPQKLNTFSEKRGLTTMAAWGVIIFELSFPLALISRKMALIFLVIGLVFHFINSVVLGLNRFLFAWTTAYVALYYCSQ